MVKMNIVVYWHDQKNRRKTMAFYCVVVLNGARMRNNCEKYKLIIIGVVVIQIAVTHLRCLASNYR